MHSSGIQSTKDQTQCAATASVSVNNYIDKCDIVNAELWSTLNTVDKNHSFRCTNDNKFLYNKMFPKSEIAKKYSCAETKSMYLCYYALAPHFLKLLHQKIRMSENYVILFDESLNEFIQKKQLDFHVRLNCHKIFYF